MDKKGDAVPIKFWLGLEDEIRQWARSQSTPVNFQQAVNSLIDRGLYFSSYHFPHFKMKFTINDEEESSK
jgi:hypothetical protein